jgi:hypothetical protein
MSIVEISAIHKDIAEEIISNNFLHEIATYLERKKIKKNEWPLILSELVRRKDERISNSIAFQIQRNVDELLEDLDNFIFLLLTLTENGYDSSRLSETISSIKVDHAKLSSLYKKMMNSSNHIIKECSSTTLGLIGRKSANDMFRQLDIGTLDVIEKKRINIALHMASFKPFRDPNFELSESVFKYVTKSLSSENNEASLYAVAIAIRLFDLDRRFLCSLQGYIDKSDTNKNNFLKVIYSEWLYFNRDSEVLLLVSCSNTNSIDIIKNALAVYAGKLDDKYIDIKDRQILQKRALDLVKKWQTVEDFIRPERDSYLLENICKVDPDYNLSYAINWITQEDIIPVKHRFYYPSLFYKMFRNHEDLLVVFIRTLIQNDKKFDVLVAGILEEVILDLRSRLNSEFKIFNNTITTEFKRLLGNKEFLTEIDSLIAKNLDDVPSRMSLALNIIEKNPLPQSNPHYRSLEHKKKELDDKLTLFSDKNSLLSNCLQLLIQLSTVRGLNHAKLTRNYRSVKLKDIMTSCEILRNEVFRENREVISYSDIENKLDWFPNIKKYLGIGWLQRKYSEGYPYHWILFWLSKASSQEEQTILLSKFEKESDIIKKENLSQVLRLSIRAVAWLTHIDHCLDYFNKGNQRGRKAVIGGLKSEDHFFQFLSQLDIAIRLQEHGYKAELEVPSINGRSIDIVATKNGTGLIFELATLDMYDELKYSRFSANVPDRPRSKMLEKLNQINDYAIGLGYPIILILNLTEATDTDLFGIASSLRGSEVGHFGMDNGQFVNRYASFERDPEFLAREEGKKLSAVICYYSEFLGGEMKLKGSIIHNVTADNMLDKKSSEEINSALFG